MSAAAERRSSESDAVFSAGGAGDATIYVTVLLDRDAVFLPDILAYTCCSLHDSHRLLKSAENAWSSKKMNSQAYLYSFVK